MGGKKSIDAVSSEIADVLAWIVGAWHISYPGKSLNNSFIDYFFDGCPVCKRKVCNCAAYNSRSMGLVDEGFLNRLKEVIEKINWNKEDRNVITEILNSISISIETQNDPMSRITLNRTKTKLISINSRIKAKEPQNMLLLRQINSVLVLIDENKF